MKKIIYKLSFIAGLLLLLPGLGRGQAVNFDGLSTYTEDFQSITATVLAPATISSTTMLDVSAQAGGLSASGWFLYQQASGTPRWGRSNGSSSTGSFFGMYDAQATPDRALGSEGSSSIVAFFGVVLKNTSGSTINSVTFSYDAVINRNPSTTVNPYPLSYLVSSTAVSGVSGTGAGTFNDGAGTWTAGIGFTTPSTGTGAPGSQAVITPLFRIGGSAITQTLTGLSWGNNQYLYIRWKETDDAGSDAIAGVDNFSFSVTSTSSATLANITQPSGSIIQGNTNTVLSGFTITPTTSVDFTAVTVTGTGTATATDINNVRIFRDNDGNGAINGADAAVSGTSAYAASMPFSITGETGFSAVRNYLVVADVAGVGVSTAGNTVTASVASGDFTTTATTNTGSATGNPRTIIAPPGATTITAGAGAEPLTISSLTNTQGAASLNFDFTITDDGAIPATDALASQISQIVLNAGTGNTVTDWSAAIAGAELSDGTNTTTAATIGTSAITFAGIANTVGSLGYIADNATKTYTLKIWVKASLSAALKTTIDGEKFVFSIQTADVTVAGSQLALAQNVNSGSGNNAVDVTISALAFVQQPTNSIVNNAMAPAVSVAAVDANGNRDLDYVASIRITSTGTLTGAPVDVAAVAGLASFAGLTHTAAGTGLTLTAVRTATLDLNVVSSPFDVSNPPTLTDVIVPQYMQGNSSSNTSRMPYVYRVTLSNLFANTTYRYYNQVVLSSDLATASGAGNIIFYNASGTYTRTTSPGMTTAGSYGTFTTDATGAYTGWFITEPTGNARFTPGNSVFMRITLDGGNNGVVTSYLTTTNSVNVINFATTTTANDGSGILGLSNVASSNMVMLYDNTAGTGRPVAGTYVEDDGVANTTGNSYAGFYSTNVNGTVGAWGAIIPNVGLANGIGRIEYLNSNGSSIYATTSTTGIWNGVNTVNPTAGSTALVIDNTAFDGNSNFIVNSNVALSNATVLSGALTFNSGVLTTSSGNMLSLAAGSTVSGAGSGKYVNGPLSIFVNSAASVSVPTGKAGSYRPIVINSNGTAATYTAEFFRAAGSTPNNTSFGPGIASIDASDYWSLVQTSGVDLPTLTLGWDATTAVTNYTLLHVVHNIAGVWTDAGANNITGSNTSGTINSNPVVSLGLFTIGASNVQPLVIGLDDIAVVNKGGANEVTWHAAAEGAGDYYELEKSTDGRSFTKIAGMEGGNRAYSYSDANVANGLNAYRVKMISRDGAFAYSKIVSVTTANTMQKNTVAAYPNPVQDQLHVQLGHASEGSLILTDITGKVLCIQQVSGDKATVDMSRFAKGAYFIRYAEGDAKQEFKIIK